MTARISLVALLAVMAGAAFAQEPPASPPTTEKAPSMQTDQMTPSTTPAPQAAGRDRADPDCSGAVGQGSCGSRARPVHRRSRRAR